MTVTVVAPTDDSNRPPVTVTRHRLDAPLPPAKLNVLANDIDPDGDALVLRVGDTRGPDSELGLVNFDSSGQLVFTPDANGATQEIDA